MGELLTKATWNSKVRRCPNPGPSIRQGWGWGWGRGDVEFWDFQEYKGGKGHAPNKCNAPVLQTFSVKSYLLLLLSTRAEAA